MKRFFCIYLVLSVLFSTSFSVSLAECSHVNLDLIYTPEYSYEYIDDTYHNVYVKLTYTCMDCGESVVSDRDHGLQEHSISGGVCSCGAEGSKVCKHEDLDLIYTPEYSYEYIDDAYHNVYVKLTYTCMDCGESIVSDRDHGLQEHSISGGVCSCGAEGSKVCKHENLDLIYTPEYRYEYVNETYHNVYVTLTYTCMDCGESVVSNEDYGWQEHSFDGYWCSCGATRNCQHKNLELIYSPEYEYIYINATYHNVYVTLTYTCSDCGEPVVSNEDYGWQEHFYNNGLCGCYAMEPIYTKAPTPTIVITAEPTLKPTNTPAPIYTPVPTSTQIVEQIVTVAPIVHICTYTESHWYGVYNYYNEEQHTRHHVITPVCTECGKNGEKTNTLEYVSHVFENNVCTKCNYEKITVNEEKNDNSAETEKLIQQELEELANLLDIAIKLKENKIITSSYCVSIAKIISTKIDEYNAVRLNKKQFNEIISWEEIPVLNELWTRRNEVNDYNYSDKEEVVSINLEKPDNKWYYFITDAGEQIFFGNFSEKVTIIGVAGQIIVGEIPIVGTVADARDVVADIVKWEWTWQHAGTTVIDTIGLIPLVGALKYTDEIAILAKGVKLSDEAGEVLTSAVKHIDDVGNVSKNSDEIAEVVGEAVTKHLDDADEVVTSTINTFDELKEATKNSEIFTDNALEHIFIGNKTGGFHYEGLSDTNGKIIEIVGETDINGVYSARIEINGKMKKEISTFFPKNWTPEQVIQTIDEAYTKREYISGNRYKATTSSGITVMMYLNENDKVISAYPIME